MKSSIFGLLAVGLMSSATVSANVTVTDPNLYKDLTAGISHDLAGFSLTGPVGGPAALSVRYGQWNGPPGGVLDIVLTFNGAALGHISSSGAYFSSPASTSLDVSSLVTSGFNSFSAFATNVSAIPVTYALGEISLEYVSSAVPELGSLAQLGLGLAGLAFAMRRKA